MAWWQFLRRTSKDDVAGATSANGAQTTHRTVMGRRFLRGVPYVLPKDMDEVNRLDFQHYMMRYGLRGNYAAPIGAPDSILDVGSGTGRWAIEMAERFPHARVVGVDVAPSPASAGADWEQPSANYSFTQGNVLEGLSFADATFAFTHQRYMIGAIPGDQWPRVVGELARVTRPGGWIEVVEADTSEGGGPALQQVDAWVAAVLARRHLDIHLAERLESFLQQAGLRQVTVNRVRLPLGAYGGRVGSLVETDYFAAVQAMRTPVVTLGFSAEDHYDATVRAAREEVKRGKCVFPIYVVFGQRV